MLCFRATASCLRRPPGLPRQCRSPNAGTHRVVQPSAGNHKGCPDGAGTPAFRPQGYVHLSLVPPTPVGVLPALPGQAQAARAPRCKTHRAPLARPPDTPARSPTFISGARSPAPTCRRAGCPRPQGERKPPVRGVVKHIGHPLPAHSTPLHVTRNSFRAPAHLHPTPLVRATARIAPTGTGRPVRATTRVALWCGHPFRVAPTLVCLHWRAGRASTGGVTTKIASTMHNPYVRCPPERGIQGVPGCREGWKEFEKRPLPCTKPDECGICGLRSGCTVHPGHASA